MAYNTQPLTKTDLLAMIQDISNYTDKQLDFYALGGTALTLLNIKSSTLDVDINIPKEQRADTKELFKNVGFKQLGTNRWLTQEGFAFDVFHDEHILGTQLLPDCLEKAKHIQTYNTIRVYTLHPYDIIISKLARGDDRDFADIHELLKHKKINYQELIKRYKQTMNESVIAHEKQKLLDLIEIKLADWNINIPQEFIEEVKQWS